MNVKQVVLLIAGTIVSLLGLLWALQGAGVLVIPPILCVANCEPITGRSLPWLVMGIAMLLIGVAMVTFSLKRVRA